MLSLLLLSHSTERSGSGVTDSERLPAPAEEELEVEVERDTPRAPAMTARGPAQQVPARARKQNHVAAGDQLVMRETAPVTAQ